MAIDPWLASAAATMPDREALVTPRQTLSYRELADAAAAVAGGLAAIGVGPGERVALPAHGDAGFAVALHAILWLGAVALPVDPRLSDDERVEREARADHTIDSPAALARTGPLAPLACDADAPALLLHTSGTTGPGAPVELTHGNLLASALGSAVALGLDPAERWLCTLPLAHIGGLSILLRSAIYATTAVLHPRFDSDTVAGELVAGQTTVVSLVPTTLARLLDGGLARPPALRRALIGGAPMSASLRAAALEAGVPVVGTYGLTEASSQVTTARDPDDHSAGPPLPLTRVRVGDAGEILVDGPTVAPGARAPDGVLHTGDVGQLDESGRLHVTGRLADTIVTGGENVAPDEVEAILLSHPDVTDAAVYGRADVQWGEAVSARVVLRAGAATTSEALREHCAAKLAAFKVPKRIEFADALPRTPSGKPRRTLLR
ncbi:MAG: class I adenylate-forming enzyme family protein [Solirubrobacteraceae bacterium]